MALENDDQAGGNPAADELDEDAIRARAYEISERGEGGSPEENWDRAVAELRAEHAAGTARPRT
jgi:hypothetical protein